MSLVNDVLQRVRVHIAQRRLRLNDFFSDFDRLRSGRITAEQMRRALAVNYIPLSDEEFAALVSAFAAPAGYHDGKSASLGRTEPFVSYVNFLRALQAEDPPDELLTTLRRRPNELSEEEEAQLRSAMESLRNVIRSRGLHPRKCFEDFDRFHSGKVSASVFRRCIPIDGLREGVINLIIKKYRTEEGDVLYAAWCNDLEEKPQVAVREMAPVMPSGSNMHSRRGPSTVDNLLRMLREQISMYHLRCDDYLRDYDRFRTGFVSASQFESALGQLRLVDAKLTADDIDALTRAYTDKSCVNEHCEGDDNQFVRVNYVRFLEDTSPYCREAEGKPTNYLTQTRAPGQFTDEMNEQERQQTQAVLEKVRRLIRSNRIHLTPTMQDFDRVRKGIYEHRTCTASRFIRSLATHKIFLKPEEVEILVRRYSIRAPHGGRADEVNYFQFVMDVELTKNDSEASRIQNAAALLEIQKNLEKTRSQPADTVIGVLVKIAAQAEERHLRVNEFFIDFDPLRSGSVQEDKFVVALGIAGVQLQASEAELLKKEYTSTKVPGYVDVNRFIADVGKVEPSAVPSVSTKFNFTTASSQTAEAALALKETVQNSEEKFTVDELETLRHLQVRLNHDVNSHQALLMPFFSDFDRLHRAKISRTNFLQALSRHRFTLTPAETTLLARYYASPEDTESIEYRRFVRDVGVDEVATGELQNSFFGDKAPTATGEQLAPNDADSVLYPEGIDEKSVEEVLSKICFFLQERKPRLGEFFPDGDELRHRHVTNFRFRHCLSMLGLHLTERELRTLELSFSHAELEGHVNYPFFLAVVREKLKAIGENTGAAGRISGGGRGITTCAAVESSDNTNLPCIASAASMGKVTEEEVKGLHASVIDKVRRTLASRRSASLSAFRQYDRARKGFVKEGQFFATLMSLGVQLTPVQADLLRKMYGVGGGEIGYVQFSMAADDPRFE